jgi:hypothetical protein
MALYPVAQVLEPLRLWKLTSDVVSTEHRWIEHLIFLLFAVLPLSQPLIAFSSFFDC